MATDLNPYITLAEGLQAVVEALEQLGGQIPAHDRDRFNRKTTRIRQQRVDLLAWIERARQ